MTSLGICGPTGLSVSPKGLPCLPGLQPAGREVTVHYGYTGMAVLGYGEPILVDGVNEAGLMGALLHYPEYAIYPPKPRPDQMSVHPGRLLAYLFGLCSGVEEVAALLSHRRTGRRPLSGQPSAGPLYLQ